MNLEDIQKYGLISNQLCAVNSDALRTASSGSCGGPLQSYNSRSCLFTVVGVLSNGNKDDEQARKSKQTVVDVYTRVAPYLDWIEKVVWNVEPSSRTNPVQLVRRNGWLPPDVVSFPDD